MRQVLSVYRRQIGVSFAAAAVLGGGVLLLVGELRLIGALLAGEAAAALYFVQLAQRLLRTARLGAAAGSSQVRMGLVLMLCLIGTVFWAATTVSEHHFFAAVGGFLLLHAVMMLQLIVHALRTDK